MEEKVLISIEVVKGDNEAQIDAVTRKITELQKATAELKKENNELIKQGKENSDQYVENTRQIEVNKQKINEASASRKGLIQTLLSEEKSIKSLRVANAELIKQRDNITTSTAEGRAEIARLNKTIDENNELIQDNLDKASKQKAAIGGYKDAIKDSIPFFRQGEQAFFALAGGAKVFTKALVATGIGIFVLALGALISYFKRTEEGADALKKIMFTVEAIMGKLGDAAALVGKYLFDAFTNPKQALIDFGNFLQSQLINRFTGILNLIPELGRALDQVFKGNFKEAATIAVDAAGKVVLGIEHATDKILGFADSISTAVDEAFAQGEKLGKLDKLLGDQEEALTVQRSKTALEVAKIREDALKQEGDAKKKTIQEAIALEQQLSDAEVAFANTKLKMALEQQRIDGVTGETKLAVAQAEAAVIDAQATAFSNSLRFRKEIAAIDEASAKEQAALLAEANKMLDDAEKLELDRQKRIQEALIATEELRLEQAIVNAASIEERVNREIELETFKTFALLENTALLEAERQLILEKSQANINAIIVKGTQERVKKELVEEEKLKKEKDRLRNENLRGVEASADAAVGFAQAAFGQTKGVAIAEATINTIAGVARALKDYIFPYSLIVGALTGAAGAVQIAKIASTSFARGGIAASGGVLRGPLHRDGGIPFSVGGRTGFEAEGGEAIINRRSTRMFRPLLSSINQAGGGVAFDRGGVTRFQTGSITGNQTRQAAQVTDSRAALQNSLRDVMANFPPIFTSIVDINERAQEVNDNVIKSQVV